ncbi:hypothetical protein [Marinobacter sp. LV10R520-4]|uniref:hypothetical protein n=1 Tax=Marinobacter sp. LV10R520-4 TaxID=1761796 RepID=UPI00117F12F3|nr:hypothetical protein [Marinobacter sp. LV10R520-4]
MNIISLLRNSTTSIMTLTLVLSLGGCASLSNINDSKNVIEYSMAKHGFLLDEIIPIAKLTGVREEDSYEIYYDRTEKIYDWNDDYRDYCLANAGQTLTSRNNDNIVHCIKNDQALFSWIYASKQNGYKNLSQQRGMLEYQYKVERRLVYFIVLMPTKPDLELTYIDNRLFNYGSRLR